MHSISSGKGASLDFSADLLKCGHAYVGTGSRATPPDMLATMTAIGNKLGERGLTLRSGDAGPADAAFEKCARQAQIFIPWPLHTSTKRKPIVLAGSPIEIDALLMTSGFHNDWSALSLGSKLLSARSYQEIFGADLQSPAAFALCWTADAADTGRTGQIIRMARAHNVPVFNLAAPDTLKSVLTTLKIIENP